MANTLDSELATAEASLQRGDYGQSLVFLESLASQYPLPSKEGAKIRILMITAWMGQGEDQKAIATCRLLTNQKESTIRQQAKQLISILEAPSLSRPDNWSIKIPQIDLETKMGRSEFKASKPIKEKIIVHPPTGPTRAFDIGFPTIVVAILIILTIFLSN